ncbi:unnamed protein product, partial [Heterosigma akashiwo]
WTATKSKWLQELMQLQSWRWQLWLMKTMMKGMINEESYTERGAAAGTSVI